MYILGLGLVRVRVSTSNLLVVLVRLVSKNLLTNLLMCTVLFSHLHIANIIGTR